MNFSQYMTTESIEEFKEVVKRVSAYVNSLDENDTSFDEAYGAFNNDLAFGSYSLWLAGKVGL